MGWTFTHRDKGTTNNEFFMREFNPRTIIHASATVGGVYYAAVETARNPGHVFAFTALIQWDPKEYHNFGYKDIGEDMGPNDALAPLAVINALSPTDDTYAQEWRDQCRFRHAQRAFMKKHLRDGDKVKLSKVLKFTSGTSQDTFSVDRVPARGGKTKVILSGQGRIYLIPNWRDQVVSIFRDGFTEIEAPLKARMVEDAYVERVAALSRENPANRAAINFRHNVQKGDSADWLVREKFRQEGPWGGLDALDSTSREVAA